MDDAQAEAALLAIGAALEWRRAEYDDLPNVEIAEAVQYGYAIFNNEVSEEAVHFVQLFETAHGVSNQPPKKYQRRIDAKAACERHHATGNWD